MRKEINYYINLYFKEREFLIKTIDVDSFQKNILQYKRNILDSILNAINSIYENENLTKYEKKKIDKFRLKIKRGR